MLASPSTGSSTSAAPAAYNRSDERSRRRLTAAERKVKAWVQDNYGVLSEVARTLDPPMSVQSVYHIAYNLQGRKSKGLRVEHELLRRGCPLIQKIR